MNPLHDFKSEIKLFLIVAVASVLIATAGILLLQTMQVAPAPTPGPGNNTQVLEGIVRFESLEGGCWYLQVPSNPGPLEDIEKYELLGVSEAVLDQYRDQQVTVKGNTREDMASICQIGTIFEVEEISSANGNNQQPTIDTSDWQTYRNDEYGFEVEYPSHWKVDENSTTKRVFLIGENERYFISIDRWVDNKRTPEEVARTLGMEFVFPEPKSVLLQSTPYISKFYYVTTGSDLRVAVISLEQQRGNYLKISTSVWPENESKELFNQILSTFRFVDPATQIQWNWELLGCGGQTPCSYRVSSSEWPNSYVCAGKYNPLSGQGEITPTTSTDPRTTVDFTCSKE